MSWQEVLLQQLINGLTIGMIYALIALGYTMVYGIIQLINFAHGEVFMVGAYLGLSAFVVLSDPGGVLVTALLGTALLGLFMERFAYRPLRDAPRLAPLIAAIGVSFVLQNAVMLFYGPFDKSFPSLFQVQRFSWGSVTITNLQLLIGSLSLLLMLGLHLFVQNTKVGKAMRALADDRPVASLMGIPVNRIIAITFLVGSAMAGIGGVLFGTYYTTINFHDGYLAGLKAFTAAVLGGIGNIPGAMLGGVLLGLLEGLGAGYLSSEWKNVFAFIILILLLLYKPSGLLGERVVKKV